MPGPRGVPDPRGTWSGEGAAPDGVWSQGAVCSWGVPGGDPPGTATAASGTHPTGMHSCLANVYRKLHDNERNWARGGAHDSLDPPMMFL